MNEQSKYSQCEPVANCAAGKLSANEENRSNNKKFPYKLIIYREKGLYFGNSLEIVNLLSQKPSFRESKNLFTVVEH